MKSDTNEAKSSTNRTWRVLPMIAVFLAAAAGVFAIVAACQWIFAANDESLQLAVARDDVLRVGQQELINFYSIDYHNLDQTMNRLTESSTGTLHDLLTQKDNPMKQQIVSGQLVTSATIGDAVITELDNRSGSAKLIAVMQVTGSSTQNPKLPARIPVQSELTRTNSGWKLSGISQVVLGSSSLGSPGQ